MSDPLSDAVDELGLRRASFRRIALGRTRVQGPALLLCDAEPIRCGDTTVAPGDAAIVLQGESAVQSLRGDTEATVGALSFDAPDHPMLLSLPAVLVCPAAHEPRLRSYIDALRFELSSKNDGRSAIAWRLSEILLLEAIRFHAERSEECPAGGWFRGLRDPSLARSLSAFHANVAGPWTVASLAQVAGQSRTRFAARFSAVMGEPPLSFVTRWRMFHVRRLLRGTDASIEEIAARVGYANAAALSVAFAREHQESPGSYRSKRRPAASAERRD